MDWELCSCGRARNWQPQVRKPMKNMRAGFSLAVFAAAILLLLQTVVLARAQDQDQGYDQDPPTRAGRISFVQGSVSFQPGGEGDWVEASQNRTLTVGDNLWVDRDSRAELQIGSTSIRLAPRAMPRSARLRRASNGRSFRRSVSSNCCAMWRR